MPLEPFAEYVFKNPYAEVYLEFGDEGRRLTVHAPVVNQVYTFLKDPAPPWTPTKEELTSFTGKYYSSHLDYYWTLELNAEGQIVVKRPTVADSVIEPEKTDQFILRIETFHPGNSDDARILFHRSSNGKPTHFTVWHQRLMHHRFDKVEVTLVK